MSRAVFPLMDGVASTGSSNERARIDHVHPSDPSKANVKDLARVALTGSYNDLKDAPEESPPVTEQTVAGWGFTKNTGTYSKPSGGIPDSDIASAANWNARGTYSKPSGGIPKSDLASDVQASLGKADTALQEIADVIYDIPAEFHAETSDHYFTFASGISASTILSALNVGKLPVVRNDYGSLKRRWYYSDYNNDGNDIYIQFFRETQFSREVMLYTESDAKAYIDSVSLSSFQRKPVTVWEVDGTTVTEGLKALQTDIAETMNWQLTNLNLSPYKRIKVYSKGGQGQTNAGTTGAMILEMSLDPRMAIATKGGHYVGSVLSQKPNDANRYASLTCAVSADKTSFAVLRQSSLYGTAATTNNDIGADVVLIEGYYD